MSGDGKQDHAPQDDPVALARAFAAARFRVELEGEDIGFAVGREASAIEERLPAAGYAFVTAWNPDAEHQPLAENVLDDDALAARLDASGAIFHRARAEDAEGGHREAGWLVAGIDAARADALGRAFGQAGILWWPAGSAVRLHMLRARPDSPDADLRDVDWVE